MEEELKKFLAQFGKVEICEVYDNEVKIRITDGWKNNFESFDNLNTINLKIEDIVGKEFPYIRETKMDSDYLQIIFYRDGQ
jgi:hypothetical protein